jgi:hypothetical protein
LVNPTDIAEVNDAREDTNIISMGTTHRDVECSVCKLTAKGNYYIDKETGYDECDSDKDPMPDYYTDPTAYLEAMAWAQKQEWWGKFVLTGLKLNMPTHLTPDESLDYMVGEVARCILDPKLGSHALASYLRERKEKD